MTSNIEITENPYLSHPAKIVKIIDETENVKTFVIKPVNGVHKVFHPYPGQFAMWDLPGIGEAPFSYSWIGDHNDHEVHFTIQRIGRLTNAVFKLNTGDTIRMRGPYGNGFPMNSLTGKNLIFIMGGIGSAPLRGVYQSVFRNKEDYGQICLLHGARSPEDMLFKQEFLELAEHPSIKCLLTVDGTSPDDDWSHHIGVVTTLFDKFDASELEPKNTAVLICGPPIMYEFVIKELERFSIPQDQIFMTLERRMKCGIGKCGHCAIDSQYACTDGPVFTLQQAKTMREII